MYQQSTLYTYCMAQTLAGQNLGEFDENRMSFSNILPTS